MRWCQVQLVGISFAEPGMQNLDLFAKAAHDKIMAKGMVGYNWGNEQLLPPAPPYRAPANPPPEQPRFPPRPENPTRYISWLYENEERFTPGFRSWIGRQLAVLIDGTLYDMESFAEAAHNLRERLTERHDWENEDDLERPPPFLLPQVRQLYRLIEHELPEKKHYFQRQIDDAVDGTDINKLAADLIIRYEKKGSIDWDKEDFIVKVKTPHYPPDELVSHAPGNGVWNVSTCIAASSPTIVLIMANVVVSST